MPISFTLPTLSRSFRARFLAENLLVSRLFTRIGAAVTRRLRAARTLDAQSRAFPVVVLRDQAVEAWIDRSQHDSLEAEGEEGSESESDAGGSFLDGLGRIPAGIEAGTILPRTMRAAASLLERIDAWLREERGRDRVLGLKAAYDRWAALGSSGILQGLYAFAPRLPRIAAAIAVILASFARFVRTLGARGGAGLSTFAESLDRIWRLGDVLRELFPSDSSGAPSGESPNAGVRKVTGMVVLALLAIPALGLYLSALVPKAALGLRLAALDLFEQLEGRAWAFRRSLFELFFVGLEQYRRDAVHWLEGIQTFLLSQVSTFASFVGLYVEELFQNLRVWAESLGNTLETVTTVIRWIGRILTALFDFNLLALLFPVPGVTLTLMNLVEIVLEGSAAAMSAAEQALRAVEAVAPHDLARKIAGLRGILRMSVRVISLPEEPPRPSIAPFPNVFELLLGSPGREGLLEAFRRMRSTSEDFASAVVESGQDVLFDVAVTAVRLRDRAASSDLSARFDRLLTDADGAVSRLMGPELERLRALDRPTGLENLAETLHHSLSTGGFWAIGASIARYIASLRAFWQEERSTGPTETLTSPHILARRARLSRVEVEELQIRAPGRRLDEALRGELVSRVRRAVSDAFREGEIRFQAAGGAI